MCRRNVKTTSKNLILLLNNFKFVTLIVILYKNKVVYDHHEKNNLYFIYNILIYSMR